MFVNANNLKTSPKQVELINRTVIDILKDIDEKIREYSLSGKYKLSTSIPILFNIDELPNYIAQRKIYSAILKSLKDRNFEVNIDLTADYCQLHIRWASQEEVSNIAAENELIAQCRLNKFN